MSERENRTDEKTGTDGTSGTKGTDGAESAHSSHESHTSQVSSQGFIPSHGGYEALLSFRKARIVYDATVKFCARFVDRHSRTTDQMVQAARSGKQNIIEGSQAAGTSNVETRPAAVVANLVICLIHQTNYLLDQQLRRLEQEFLKGGGLRERMTRARLDARAWPAGKAGHA